MTESIKAIIIDDEERGRSSLLTLAETYCPEVTILGSYANVPEGVLAINRVKPNLVFLDIEMPEYTGFDLLDFFREVDFEIIFVTAYSEYAIRAFEVSAVDYLLKPVQIELLQAAVEKVKTRLMASSMRQRLDLLKETYQTDQIRKIALPMSDGLLFIDTSDLVLIEADGAYSHIYLKNGSKILVSKKLKFFEDILQHKQGFYRPHRSYLIHLNFIKKYIKGDSLIIMDNQVQVNVARERKQEFEQLLRRLKLLV